MSRKRPSLFSGTTTAPRASTTAATVRAEAAPTGKAEATAAKAESIGRPPSRQGKRVVSVYVEPEAAKQLGIIAIQEDTTIQALMVEALNDFFAKRGTNRIA